MNTLENTLVAREQTTEVICHFLENLWHETLGGQLSALFFHSPDGHAFSLFLDKYLESLFPGARIVRCRVRGGWFGEPYQPFLGFIKQFCQGKNAAEIRTWLYQAGLYHSQKEIFESYLIDGVAVRREELLFEELGFEKSVMLESFSRIFSRIAQEGPLVLVIEDLHLVRESSLQLLRYILECSERSHILLLAALDKDYSVQQEGTAAAWEDFIDFLENKNVLMNFALGSLRAVLSAKADSPGCSGEAKDLLQHCVNSYHLLALKECQEDIELIIQRKMEQQLVLSAKEHFRLLLLLGDVSQLNGENNSAMGHYNSALNIANQSGLKVYISDVCRKIGSILHRMGDYDRALEYAQYSLELAEEAEDKFRSFYVLAVLVEIADRSRSKLQADWAGYLKKALILAKELKMINTFACLSTRAHLLYDTVKEEADDIWDKGIKTAQRNGNRYRLAAAYQEMGCAMAHIKGDYKAVLSCYQKSLRLTLQLGNQQEITYAHNAMGYYYFLTGEYERAHSYYTKALQCLKFVRDYPELGMTLYNMTLNCFFGLNYTLAANLLEKILQIMSVLKISSLRYQSLFGIYALLVSCYCKAGNLPKAYEALASIRMKGLMADADSEQDFLYTIACALLATAEGNYPEAERYFREALVDIERQGNALKHYLPCFYHEYASMKAESDGTRAEQRRKQGLAISQELGNHFYEKLFKNALAGWAYYPAKLELEPNDLLWAIESVKQWVNFGRLRKKVNEINFLNVIQNLLTTGTERPLIICSVMELVHRTFLLDMGVAFLKDKEWSCVYGYGVSAVFEQTVFCMLPELLQKESGKVTAALDNPIFQSAGMKKYYNFRLANKKGQDMADLFFGATNETADLTYEELKVLNIAFSQLAEALDRIEQEKELVEKNKELSIANQQLATIAVTDALTGLANRYAMMKWFTEGKWRFKRNPSLSLLFLDLDHFKYYNDTFGHQVGDMILCRFTDILRSVVRGEDFVARYGGDEFIILLPGMGNDGAVKVARRINQELEHRRQLKDDIETMIGQKVTVPRKYLLTCSVGISDMTGIWEKADLETFLQQADKALYLAKRSGKKRYKTWSDVVSKQS